MNLILQVLTGTFPPFLARRKTPRKRSPEYLRKKEILASLSDQEYARRRALATANMQRWRAKKKLNATTKGIDHDNL